MNKLTIHIFRRVEMLKFASLLFVLFVFFSCSKDNITGMTVLDTDDEILVGTDTFRLLTYMIQAEHIPSDPDSILLGEADNNLGTLHADFITQLTCPEGFVFPENAVLDSATLTLYYQNWYGDGNSPMAINIYQLDKKTLDYDSVYYSDIDISEYCSKADSTIAVTQPRIITAASPKNTYSSSSVSLSLINFRLTDPVMNKLYNGGKYLSQQQFNEAFKGFYVTTEFGSATVLYIVNMAVTLHYHFSYQLNGRDTTSTDAVYFYSTDEVRNVNRVQYTHTPDYAAELMKDSTISYIASPANIYTVIDIPMAKMVESVKDSILNGKRPYVNSAEIKIYATNYTTQPDSNDVTQWAQPPRYMLMIAAEKAEDFFYSRSLPNDSTALLSALATETDSLDNTLAYYSYDVSYALTEYLHNPEPIDTFSVVLIPVSVAAQTSTAYNTTTITSVRPLQIITNTTINTEFNSKFPLRLSVVATGL